MLIRKAMKCDRSCAIVLNSCVENPTAESYSSNILSVLSMLLMYCFCYPHSVLDICYYVSVVFCRPEHQQTCHVNCLLTHTVFAPSAHFSPITSSKFCVSNSCVPKLLPTNQTLKRKFLTICTVILDTTRTITRVMLRVIPYHK